jgi:hypothetical protein
MWKSVSSTAMLWVVPQGREGGGCEIVNVKPPETGCPPIGIESNGMIF